MYRAARVMAGAGLFVLIAWATGPVSAQPAPAKKVLTFPDEHGWRTAAPPVLSPDGTHVAYTVSVTDGDGEAVVRHVASGKEYKFPRGGGFGSPKFTPDGKRVLLPLSPTKAQVEKAKADKAKPEDMPRTSLAVVDLATGGVVEKFPQTGLFAVGGEGLGFVIYREPAKTEPAKDKDDDKKGTGTPTEQPKKGGKFQFPPGKGPGGPGRGGSDDAPPGPVYGTPLHIRDLATKVVRTIPDVTDFTLTRDTKLLIYTVSSKKEETNGIYAVNPRSGGSAEAIKSGPGRYANPTWDEKQTKLAFLYDDSMVLPPNVAPPPRPKGVPAGVPAAVRTPPAPPKWRAFVWDRAAKPLASPITRIPVGMTGGFGSLIPAVIASNPSDVAAADEVLGPSTAGLRPGWAVSGGSPSFSPDGSMLFVNTAPKRETPAPRVGPPDPTDFQLDLWHWKDERLQPMQKLEADRDRNKTYSAVVFLNTKEFRQLSDDTITVGQPQLGSDWAVGVDDRKYRHMTGYMSPLPRDYALVNVRTGETKPLMANFKSGLSLSPTGVHALGFDGKDWFTIAVADGKKTNLTANLKVKFFDEDDDHPGLPPPAGQPQWTADGKFVLVNDAYDIWKLAADGSTAENITKVGRAQQIRFSIIRLPQPDDAPPVRGVDLSKPQLLGAENQHTRDTGFYRLEPGAKEPKLLIMGARRYGPPTKAKNADVYMLTMQTFSSYPDYYLTNADFHELKRVTDINPRVKEFNWGKAELVHYKSADGVPLSGVLIKPEDFDPSKKYPMVVYIYERLSQGLHTFRTPVTGTSINPTFYASNGYLVYMPDIAYKVGSPGQSALKCVLPAIQAVCDKGYVDENAIGIQGHSWGGYQISYMVTQTNRFKAAIAGAPVSNMVSAYGGIRWGSGLTRQFQYEWTQSRIGASLWDAPMKYIENSPIFFADRVQTPLMILHNDQDDAVPWYQGIEYYLALRRLGKECYMLNYNGQPHGIANRAAARDYSARMFQFFEHHLKGKPAPAWMVKGVPYLDREKDKEEIKKLLGPEPGKK